MKVSAGNIAFGFVLMFTTWLVIYICILLTEVTTCKEEVEHIAPRIRNGKLTCEVLNVEPPAKVAILVGKDGSLYPSCVCE